MMKKIKNCTLYIVSLCMIVLFAACSDVPMPYDEPQPQKKITPTGNGTKESPYNVAALDSLFDNSIIPEEKVYARGIISRIDELDTSYGNATYYISDTGNETSQFEVYRGYGLNGEKFKTGDEIQKGDTVVVYGQLLLHGTTREFTQGSSIISINGGGDDPQPTDDYLNVKFATDLAPFVNYTISGEGAWKNDYSCATATGYDSKTKVTTPFAAFLVSPEIDLTAATEAYVEYNYILRYNKGNENQQLMITDNFSEATPSANWTLLNNTHTEGRDYTTFSVADIQIPSGFLGKKVRIAFSYNCGAEGSTWEVRDVAVKKGSFTPPTPPGPTEEGSGTYDDPYTIAGAQANQGVKGYVKGYIVGFVTGQVLASGATFSAEGAVASNILIAKSADETNVNNCIPVQLVGGSPVRAGINLMDNAGMYKKELLIYGSLEKYFGAAGLKTTTYAECDGKTFGTKPGDTPPPSTDVWAMDFKTTGSKGDWTIEDKTLPEGLTYVWNFDSKYGMKASAYISKCFASESWLISPAINLPAGVKTLSIHEAMNQLKGGNRADHVNVMVSTDKANWSVVNMAGWPAGTDWTFGDYTADFSTYAGKTIYIAFKYTSTDSCAPTWEVEKLSIN